MPPAPRVRPRKVPPMPSSVQQPSQVLVYLNDESRQIAPGTSLFAMLDELALANKPGLAVAVNASVIQRQLWPTLLLRGGDQILIIQASQGG